MRGSHDGAAGGHVVLVLSYIIIEAQLDEIVDKLARSIHEVIAAE